MSDWVYAELAKSGFDVRPANSTVLRNIPLEGARVSDLAALAGLTKQSMAYLVEQMEMAKLVDVQPHLEDRRAKTVKLTDRGRAAGARAIELSRQYEQHCVELVGAKKMATLREILTELHAKLEDRAAADPANSKSRINHV